MHPRRGYTRSVTGDEFCTVNENKSLKDRVFFKVHTSYVATYSSMFNKVGTQLA